MKAPAWKVDQKTELLSRHVDTSAIVLKGLADRLRVLAGLFPHVPGNKNKYVITSRVLSCTKPMKIYRYHNVNQPIFDFRLDCLFRRYRHHQLTMIGHNTIITYPINLTRPKYELIS